MEDNEFDGKNAWAYLEKEAAPDAPIVDNPLGLYCVTCRTIGLSHCGRS